jgi:succinyl-CoA synthetase alpha subunit
VPILTRLKPNLYKDSVALMRIAEQVLQHPAISRATLVMATPANKEILEEAGLLSSEAGAARPSDLIIVIEGHDSSILAVAFTDVESALTASAKQSGPAQEIAPRSVAMGLGSAAAFNLAQISVPGAYAGAEALKAVKAGLNVFLFSDNVPIEQEKAIKQLAARRGLIVMGPDCGTAIIGGVPLGFANVVRRGRIGLIGASGTGLQEVCCQIHLQGEGISHAIGTGGRDVKAAIGGITMLAALDLLAADADTSVIGIVSKPPAPEVMRAVVERAGRAGKPVVVCFLGGAVMELPQGVSQTANLYECAAACVAGARGTACVALAASPPPEMRFAPGQRYLRGLFSGGTFCTEAQVALRALGIASHSNVPLESGLALARLDRAEAHTMLDLGDDDFTVGRPHPMIDPSSRIARIAQEAADPETAVILLDIVLGYAGHADPAGALAGAIRDALAKTKKAGRGIAIVAFVCGTEEDPQVRSAQEQCLRAAGALLAPSSTHAAALAARLVERRAA